MASWTSRFLNEQNSSFTLSYIIEGFTHVNSCIFCYTKRKRKKIRIFNCLSKIIFALGIRPYSLRGGGRGKGGGGVFVVFVWGLLWLCYSKNLPYPPKGLTYSCDPLLLAVDFLYYSLYTLLATTDHPSIPPEKPCAPTPPLPLQKKKKKKSSDHPTPPHRR